VTYYDAASRELFVADPGQNAVYVYVNEGLYWRKVQTITSPDSVYIAPQGLTAQYYNFGGPLSVLPSFGGSPALTRTEWAVNTGITLGSFAPGMQADHFAVRWTGYIETTATQDVTFSLGSDDGSQLYIDGTKYIDQNQLQAFTTRSASVHQGRRRQHGDRRARRQGLRLPAPRHDGAVVRVAGARRRRRLRPLGRDQRRQARGGHAAR
jgi:hypothetical protein